MDFHKVKYFHKVASREGIVMEGISWEAIVRGGNSPGGNYSGGIVQGELNCPGGIP